MYSIFFFQAEAGIRYLVRSRVLGDVYKRQGIRDPHRPRCSDVACPVPRRHRPSRRVLDRRLTCLLYTSEDADDLISVDLGGRRIIKKKT